MKTLALAACALALSACQRRPPIEAAAPSVCGTTVLPEVVGSRWSFDRERDFLRRTSARRLRVIVPDTVYTTECILDRLNVGIDAHGVIMVVTRG